MGHWVASCDEGVLAAGSWGVGIFLVARNAFASVADKFSVVCAPTAQTNDIASRQLAGLAVLGVRTRNTLPVGVFVISVKTRALVAGVGKGNSVEGIVASSAEGRATARGAASRADSRSRSSSAYTVGWRLSARASEALGSSGAGAGGT